MEITTQRLTLKPHGTQYLETTHRYASDIENTRFMTHLPNDSREDTLRFLQSVDAEWQKETPDFYEFAIQLNGTHIGAVGAYRDHDALELGWIIDKRYWGMGYASEAARGLVDALNRQLGEKRFIAHCDSENTASSRVMQKLGMLLVETSPGRKNRASDEERCECLYEMNIE